MLNRFAKDTAVLDDLLPLTVFDFIQVCRIKVVALLSYSHVMFQLYILQKKSYEFVLFYVSIYVAAYPVGQLYCFVFEYLPLCVLTSTVYANHS